jgi:hypothetical protein
MAIDYVHEEGTAVVFDDVRSYILIDGKWTKQDHAEAFWKARLLSKKTFDDLFPAPPLPAELT